MLMVGAQVKNGTWKIGVGNVYGIRTKRGTILRIFLQIFRIVVIYSTE